MRSIVRKDTKESYPDCVERLAYKPEHAVDIESGAISAATVNPADSSAHSTVTNTVVRLTENLEHIELPSSGFTIVADKGYHSEAVIAGCGCSHARAEPLHAAAAFGGSSEGRNSGKLE